jgi:hypothetical protein
MSRSELEDAHRGPDGKFYLALVDWDDRHFQKFAFTLLAQIEGSQDTSYP